jgi:hypothetical protein
MHNDRAFVPSRGVTDATTVAVTLQNNLSQPSEILLILPFQRVAGRTQSQRQDLGIPARTVHDPLDVTCHFPVPLFAFVVLALTARSIVWTETPK